MTFLLSLLHSSIFDRKSTTIQLCKEILKSLSPTRATVATPGGPVSEWIDSWSAHSPILVLVGSYECHQTEHHSVFIVQ